MEDLNSDATDPQSQAEKLHAEVNQLHVRTKQEHSQAEIKKLKDRNSQLEKTNDDLISELTAERAHAMTERIDGLVAQLRMALTVCHKDHKASKTVLKDGCVRMDGLPIVLKQCNPSWSVSN